MTTITVPFTFIQQKDGWWFIEQHPNKSHAEQRRRRYLNTLWSLEQAYEDWCLLIEGTQ
jgi:hypothetical protein